MIAVHVDRDLDRASSPEGTSFSNQRGGVHYGRATVVEPFRSELPP